MNPEPVRVRFPFVEGLSMSATMQQVPAKELVSAELFDVLCRRIERENDVTSELAESIMDQALAFLAASARFPDEKLSPSSLVDVGWHTFILYTKEYAAFCGRVAGRFIHHVPNDSPEPGEVFESANADPMTLLKEAGFLVDPKVWRTVSGKCSPGDAEDGCCAASGKNGDENTENQTPPR